MAAPPAPPEPGQPDQYWAGVSGWAMLPGALIGGAVSAVVMLAGPRAGGLVGLPADWTAFVLFWVTVVGWVSAGLLWAYRGASFVYRLTPARLYLEFGPLYRPFPPVELNTVESVEVRAWALRRLFGVGVVIVRANGRPPVRMRGVFRPHEFAAAIRRAVEFTTKARRTQREEKETG